jgi:class 3 adenylate cyclase
MDGTRRLLESFLPLRLLGRLYGTDGKCPTAIEFPAAVLFIDVSRFTALVEQLARRGHGGLEEVPKLLSLSYDRCAEQIGARGGEVLYFAGDSLLAYWAAGETGLGNAVRAAVQCAEAIRRDRTKPTNGELIEFEAALHFGIGAGSLSVAIVGGDPIWNLVAGGNAVIDAAKSMAHARSWEYVLSESAAEVLSDSAPVYVPAPPFADIAIRSPPSEWLQSFLPLQLQCVLVAPATEADAEASQRVDMDVHREVGARLDALAEIRPISALLVRITQFEHLGFLALPRQQALCASLQQLVREHGGPPGELLFDDKGLVFMTTFGARGTVHRDDPQRAVGAARAIRVAIQRFGLSASIGVATGEAFFRIVGSARRRQLMVLGPSVNRAARLMSNAHDDILCDAPTERASRAGFSFERRGTLQLEGLGEMAPVFGPLSPMPPLLPPSKPIGRQRELEFLRQAFGEVRAGTNRMVVVLGEPGIGKTTLVNAFVEELQSSGTTVSVSRGERDDQRTSLLAWRRVLECLVDLPADGEASEVLRSIGERIKDHPSIIERLPLLDEVLSIEIRQNERTRHLEGAHRADATMRLLAEIISVLAPRPLALVLEDSQWLDSASWRLLEWVLGSLSSLLLILCVRAEEIPEELRSLRHRARQVKTDVHTDDVTRFLRIVELTELNETSIRELVTRILGGVPPQDDIARTVATLAGGNPFFAEEISLTLKGEGLITERDGFWRSLRPLDGLHYFEGVERLLRERIDRLDAISQDVIKEAAVIGRSFSRAALETLHGQAIDTALEYLVAAHLVRHGPEPEHYEFRHDQIRDVVYGLIPGDLRRRLHGALANWIEATRPDAMGNDIAVLVQHFEAAGNSDKAVKYADLAATSALQIGAFREVEAFVGICLEHEPKRRLWDNEQRLRSVRWRRQLAEAHYSRGDIHEQGVAVRHALEAAGKPVPVSRIATFSHLFGRGLQLALQQVLPPVTDPNDNGDAQRWEEELARCLNQAALVDYFELRFSRGMCNLIGAVVHAERTGLSGEMAVASAQLAGGFGMIGWRKACAHFMGRAEKAALSLSDPAIHSHVCNLDALWQIGRCEWPGVDHRLDQSQSLSLKAGDQLRWCNAQGMRFWSLYYRGEQSALEPTALALLSRAQNAGNIQQEIWALRCKALCVLHTDRPREAVEILRLITSATPGVVDLAARISASGALALALARVGQSAESIEAVRETLRLLEQMKRPSSHSIIVGISGALEVLLRGREAGLSRQYDGWNDWERQALHELQRYSNVFSVGAAQLGLWTGVGHWLDGRRAQAFTVWRQALTTARDLSLRKDESIIAAEIRRWDDRV